MSKIESGKRRLDVSELARAAAALGVSVRHLLGQTERPRLAVAARLASGTAPAATRGLRRRARQLLELDDLVTQVADMPAAHRSPSGSRVLEAARRNFARLPRTKAEARRQGRDLAELTRREIDLGTDAIADLAAVIEQHFGVDVALSLMGTDADGLLMEHFGVSHTALAVQLNMLGWLTYDEGRHLRESTRVHLMVAMHADLAPTGAATTVRQTRRSPERFTRAALSAARARRVGLSVVAALLEREDDDQLWEYVMRVGEPSATPVTRLSKEVRARGRVRGQAC